MSTIDSVLLVAAGALQKDILPLVGDRGRRDTVGRARAIVLVCALISLLLAAFSRAYSSAGFGIVELTVFAGALYAAAFLPGLIGILYWNRSSATGAVLGMIIGVVSTAVWRFVVVPLTPDLAGLPEVFVGVVFGSAAFLAGSLCRPLRRRA
jgi:Na+/proline symporter